MGGEGASPFLVLEYVPGKNLDELVARSGPMSPEACVALFSQVAEGLRYLHDNHLLHRDIKPSNIFVTPDHQAKLGDFGLLKNIHADCELTRSRQSMGTMEYGAPEQFEDAKHVDRRCDLYSLGATIYTALTGKFPFGKGSHLQVMQRKFLNQFVPLRLLLPSLHPALDQLISRCLEHDPGRRPGDCDELIAALRNCNQGRAPAAGRARDADSPVVKPVGPERRATVRLETDLTANFVPFDQKIRARWTATILDVSRGGVRLQTAQAVAVQSVLLVTLGSCPTQHLMLVRWVKQGRNQAFIAGCAFVRPLATLEPFAASARPPAVGVGS
jgi:serine/threonine-protein kinase